MFWLLTLDMINRVNYGSDPKERPNGPVFRQWFPLCERRLSFADGVSH